MALCFVTANQSKQIKVNVRMPSPIVIHHHCRAMSHTGNLVKTSLSPLGKKIYAHQILHKTHDIQWGIADLRQKIKHSEIFKNEHSDYYTWGRP